MLVPLSDLPRWAYVAVPLSEEASKALESLRVTVIRYLEENQADEPTIVEGK